MNIYPLDKKFESFGWDYSNVDGHNINSLRKVFKNLFSNPTEKPKVVIAKTLKGKELNSWKILFPGIINLQIKIN